MKVKTTRKKPIPVAGNLVQVPEELLKLHKDTYLTLYMLFVNGIAFFLDLISKICFTDFNHLSNRKVETLFKAYKYI